MSLLPIVERQLRVASPGKALTDALALEYYIVATIPPFTNANSSVLVVLPAPKPVNTRAEDAEGEIRQKNGGKNMRSMQTDGANATS